ncbi:hypothetical protein ACSSWA_03490 [Melioribacter sp. Ez-97]|uniref:hypothetical protein n=1 Tax=Melioribacter sp. Ez-97 TaxID=3423434 RepID=UPI003EDB34BE
MQISKGMGEIIARFFEPKYLSQFFKRKKPCNLFNYKSLSEWALKDSAARHSFGRTYDPLLLNGILSLIASFMQISKGMGEIIGYFVNPNTSVNFL